MINKKIILGSLSALVITFLGMVLFILFFLQDDVFDSFELLYTKKKLGALMSLGALLNLPVFFYLLHLKRHEMAYGMVGTLMLLVGVVALLKFL